MFVTVEEILTDRSKRHVILQELQAPKRVTIHFVCIGIAVQQG